MCTASAPQSCPLDVPKTQEKGKAFPGHHVRDLQHGGDPVDPNNIIPAQPDVHEVFNEQYPACYDGKAPWNTVGPNLPYTDN